MKFGSTDFVFFAHRSSILFRHEPTVRDRGDVDEVQPRAALIVGAHDMPWGVFCIGGFQHLAPSAGIHIPFAARGQVHLAFQQLVISVDTPGGVSYGELKLAPAWDPPRKDPRFAKLLTELAPRE